ncbi:MAG: AtpZ/AtpI family protein [Anaerolineales bacterium]
MRKDPSQEPQSPDLPLALAGLLGQVGCVTLIVIFAALGSGLWLDSQFDTRPVFTLILVLGSVPVTIYLMVRIVLTGMARIQRRADTRSGVEPSGERDRDP